MTIARRTRANGCRKLLGGGQGRAGDRVRGALE
jgi:hypothetical protein